MPEYTYTEIDEPEDWIAAVTEEGPFEKGVPGGCCVCGGELPTWDTWSSCPWGCSGLLCSLPCLLGS